MSASPTVTTFTLTPRSDEQGVFCHRCRAFIKVKGFRRNETEVGFKCLEGHELFIARTGSFIPDGAEFSLDLHVRKS